MNGTTDREILGQPSWVLANDSVEMAITRHGGHMAPVSFARDGEHAVEPYYISPWQGETVSVDGLWSEVMLRGDFFCMPFGNGEFSKRGEMHPAHGETSGGQWALDGRRDDGWRNTLAISMNTTARVGRVSREFSLVRGENVIYDRTTISGFAGPVTMAHHAVLRAPSDNGRLLLSTSGMQFGMVYPHAFGDPAAGEYQSLEVGAEFRSLAAVASSQKHWGLQDCSVWPARRGFTDLLQVASAVPAAGEPAWTAAVNAQEGYMWFALKDAAVLPSTIVWMENAGRHGSPWSGRNCALGLEDACTFFDRGIEESSEPNLFSRRGVRTHHDLDGEGFEVNYVQGIARCPADFGQVERVSFEAGAATFTDESGQTVRSALQKDFVFGAALQERPSR